MKAEVAKALNDHINFEFHSGYIYLQLALAMEEQNYKGYSSWLMQHYNEELLHAQAFINFMIKRDETPILEDIKASQFDMKEPVEVAKFIYEHEKKVTEKIYKINDIAKKADDYATEIFMHTFINEQIEEEDITKDIYDKFTLSGDSISAKMLVDNNLSTPSPADSTL